MNRFFLLCITIGIFAYLPVVAAEKPSDPYEVRVITYSPYQDIFAWFGHSAIEVRNVQSGQATTFNFGGFYFDFKHLLEFSLGKFTFWNFALKTERALYPYRREGRHIVYQTLELTPLEKLSIRKELIQSLKPGNRFYQYDHFLDNCSTRIRDIIDKALNGDLKKQSNETAVFTFREFTHRMTYKDPVVDFLVMFLMNDTLDKPITDWDSMFLPDRMMAVIQSSKTISDDGRVTKPLVKSREDENIGDGIPYYTEKPEAPNTVFREIIWGGILLVLFAFNAVFYMKKHRFFQKLYPALVSMFGLVFGLLGTTLFFMMCFTDHKDTYWNENILLLNPITLVLLPVGILRVFDRAATLFSWLSVITFSLAILGVLLKVLPMFDQVNGQQLRVLLPTIVVIGITGIVDLVKNNKLFFINLKSAEG